MIKPIYVGLFRDSVEAIYHAKNHGSTGLYFADFHGNTEVIANSKIYFWLNDSIPYFGIYIFPKINLTLKMVALNATYLGSDIPYERGQLLYTNTEEFCKHTVDANHPASEWLLFNQDLWNNK